MQRFADDLVGDVRTVEIAGVDVIDAGGDGLAQHGQCRVMIPGRAEHAGPGELHGAVAEPLHGAVAEGEGAGFVDAGHDRISFQDERTDSGRLHLAIIGYNPHGLCGIANNENRSG